MTLKRSVISLFLVLAMLFAIPASTSGNVLAATEKINNIKIDSNGILRWDGISNLDSVYYVSVQNHQYLAKTNSYALYDTFCESGYKSGTYTIAVSCRDTSGTRYYGSINYNYVSPYTQLPVVKNIRISGDNLIWDFDSSATKGADPYFHITVKGPKGSELFIMQRNLLPKSAFALNGKYDYTVSIQVKCNGFINSEIVTKTLTGISASLPSVTGLAYSHGIVSWNKIPGADSYGIRIEFNVSNSNYRFDLGVPTNYVSLAREIARSHPEVLDNNTSYDMKVTVYGMSEDDINKTKISNEASIDCNYKYEAYPIKVYGETLTSKNDIRDLLGDGKVEYRPDNNELFFKGGSITGETEDVKDTTMFTATGDLRINGSANINANDTIFKAAGSLYFKPNSSITAYTRYKPVVVAESVAFEPGAYNIFTSDTNVFNITKNLVLLNNVSYLKVKTNSETRKVINISQGKIVIPKSLAIFRPVDGRISDDKKNILNSDGTNASEVIITKATATPTPKPTVKPTAKPTAVATSKPTAAPTAAATSKPTAAPSSKPTTAPSVTSAVAPTAVPGATATAAPTSGATGKPTAAPTGSSVPTGKVTKSPEPTVAPTGKVTTAPQITTSVDKPSDPKAQILAFVERIYTYVLDREPEAEGAAFWSDELYSFRRTGAEVGLQFIFSDEFVNRGLSDEDFVTVLYNTFFGREPEEGGFNFWTGALKDGSLDRAAVANGFIYSQEWADTCASYGIRSGGEVKPGFEIEPTSATLAFVERMYTTAMDRESDPSGLEFWSKELANFRYSGEQVGVMFFLSEEMQGFELTDEEFVTRLYKTFMDRDPEEGGFDFWVGYLADGGSREGAVLGFTRSEEFVNKCIEARILPY